MTIERHYLERVLLHRIPGIEKINSSVPGLGMVNVYIGDAKGEMGEAALADAREIAHHLGPLGTLVKVLPYNQGPGDEVAPCPPPEVLKRAHFFGPMTVGNVHLFLKTVVPGCFYVETVDGAGEINAYVGNENREAKPDLLEAAERALREAYPPESGVTIRVFPLANAPQPSRSRDFEIGTSRFDRSKFQDEALRRLACEEEERYASLIEPAIAGKASHQDVLGFRLPKNGRVYAGHGTDEATLNVLLALFDTVYLAVLPDAGGFAGRPSAIPHASIAHLARLGRVIPVFTGQLQHYSPGLVLPFIDGSGGTAVLPRRVDAATILALGKQYPFWRDFRAEPQRAAEAFRLVKSDFCPRLAAQPETAALASIVPPVFEHHLSVAESGEDLFFEKGRIAAGTLSSGGVVQAFVQLVGDAHGLKPEAKQFIEIESHVISMEMIVARGLGAAYFPGHYSASPLLSLVANLQAYNTGSLVPDRNKLDEIMRGLRIARPDDMPLERYLEIIQSTGAERVRQAVFHVLDSGQGTPDSLAKAIADFNSDVQKWRKAPANWVYENIEFFGAALDVTLFTASHGQLSAPPLTNTLIGLLLKSFIGEKLYASGFGDIEDRAFALMGGVHPAAIRLSNVRRDLA